MSWGFGGNNSNTNNNSNNTFNWGSSTTNNNNNNSSSTNNSSWGLNSNTNNQTTNWNTNSNGNSNGANTNHQSQFVTRKSHFSSLQNDKRRMFIEFEKNIVLGTQTKRDELSLTIKKLEQLPDISHSLQMYSDTVVLLEEKIKTYKHDLEPFVRKLKKEFVYSSQVQIDTQRQSIPSTPMAQLPPPFYWDKIAQFQQELSTLRKQLQSLQQHLNDTINNQQTTQIINTKSVTNALNASHRSTLNIAAQVITNHTQIQKVKQEYKRFRLRHFGDSHDPFYDRSPDRKSASVAQIQQFVNKGLEMNGLQYINTSNTTNQTSNTSNTGSNNNASNDNSNNSGNNSNGNNSWTNNSYFRTNSFAAK